MNKLEKIREGLDTLNQTQSALRAMVFLLSHREMFDANYNELQGISFIIELIEQEVTNGLNLIEQNYS